MSLFYLPIGCADRELSSVTILGVRVRLFLAGCLLLSARLCAQDAPKQPPSNNPQIKLNFLNVCTPNETEQKEIVSALKKVPDKISYTGDFEITRGRSISDKEGASKYVRLR